MEQLTALGTGFSLATKCYTTCFTISDGQEHFMIDAGGGNGVLTNLEQLGISVSQVHHLFLSHCHTDHVLGAVWMIRMACHGMHKGRYGDNLHLYGQRELLEQIMGICRFMLAKRFQPLLDTRIVLHPLEDGMRAEILGRQVTFFDTHSKKDLQYGVQLRLHNKKIFTYLGDEPYREQCHRYAYGVDYLMHEALCLESQEGLYHPHKYQHSTVKDAAECAARLQVGTLILHHTEDRQLAQRKERYTAEARAWFSGRVWMPDDLEQMEL